MIKNLRNLSLILSIVACSTYKKPMSIAEKMTYYSPSQKHLNYNLNIPVDESILSKRHFRTPSSINTEAKNHIPLKNLYFRSLYGQYINLLNITGVQSPKIMSCPTYHNDFLSLNKQYRRVSSYFSWDNYTKYLQKKSTFKKSFTAELYMPITYFSKTPKVIDLLKQNKPVNMKNTFQIYISKIYTELGSLCENGSSTNSYNFQNIYASYLNEKKYFIQNKENLKRFVNFPIFSNEIIIKSFKIFKAKSSRMPASRHRVSNLSNIYQKLHLEWVGSYIRNKY